MKAVKSGQQVNTGMDKTKKQVLIYAHYQQMRAQASMRKLSAAGTLWEDADFDSMKMDPFCREIKDSLEAKESTVQQVRVLRLWQEKWEQEKLGPKGNSILEARLTKKYQGLKFLDIDNDNKVMTVHKMIFWKRRGNSAYNVFATMDGFNFQLNDLHDANDSYWQPWEVNEDLFDCMRVYYINNTEDNVKYYESGKGCLSDGEDE